MSNKIKVSSPQQVRKAAGQRLNYVSISVILLALTAYPLSVFSADESQAVVNRLQESLIASMKGGAKIGFAGRYEVLQPVVLETHRLKSIARVAIGRYWRDLSEQEQKTYLELFSRLSVSGYASRFWKFKGEHFEIVSEDTLKTGKKIIRSDLYLDDGDTIRLEYVLSEVGGEWKIINVIAKGISDLAIKRAEYTSIMSKDGFDTLLVKISETIEKLKNKHIEEETQA